MKFLFVLIYSIAIAGAMAQSKMAPIPSIIIICSTNQSAPITIIQPSSVSMRQDFEKQHSEITNLKLTYISAKAATTKRDGENVLLIISSATVYDPVIATGNYGSNQNLQTMKSEEITIGLLNRSVVQVNGEIMNADRFEQKFKNIP